MSYLQKSAKAPQWLDGIVKKLLAKDPEKRYKSANHFLQDLKTQSSLTHTGVVPEFKDSPQYKEPEATAINTNRGFNWLLLMQWVLVIMIFAVNFPISWTVVGVLLLGGIKSSRKQRWLLDAGKLKEDELTSTVLSLSVGYWVALITAVFLFEPHERNWQELNQALNIESMAFSEVAPTRVEQLKEYVNQGLDLIVFEITQIPQGRGAGVHSFSGSLWDVCVCVCEVI